MSGHSASDRAAALAGVAQFAGYAHDLAADGNNERARLAAACGVLQQTNPDSTLDVFGGPAGLLDGIVFMRAQLEGGETVARHAHVSRYMGQIMRIAGRLHKKPEYLERIRSAIALTQGRPAEEACETFDSVYRDTISHIPPRIMVQGHGSYLENPHFAQQIRTHLLASVRCAILWRQVGGGFVQLLLLRGRLGTELMQLEREARNHAHARRDSEAGE
jgi:high frequency lysogenization protein